ncbi:MAG TPA: response regulator transcription factor [Ktedonobacterales bacterium]|jgi:DNA-binding response OmpR family regulator|nr:response regulator transcription factor [Ktedonobacterales bacterium]
MSERISDARAVEHAPEETLAPKRRILVVDDEASLREVLGQYLRRDGFVVAEAADGYEALRIAREESPDLVILDLMLPGMDGLDVCRQLRASSAAPVLVLTARGTEADTLDGFHAGADDYVVKPFSPREVVMRVQAILRRVGAPAGTAPAAGDDALHVGMLTIHPGERRVTLGNHPIALTAKEFDLLHFLAQHPRQVFSRQQLLDAVWGYCFFGDGSTVTVHMRRLREKVEDDPATPQHLMTVWGVGYKFMP